MLDYHKQIRLMVVINAENASVNGGIVLDRYLIVLSCHRDLNYLHVILTPVFLFGSICRGSVIQ